MTFYPMHMHLHSSHEPAASIGSHMAHAASLGIKHLWLTEHDVRMGTKKRSLNKFSLFRHKLFDELPNGVRAGFKVDDEHTGSYAFIDEESRVFVELSAKQGEKGVLFFYSKQKSHCDPLFAEINVKMDADIELSADGGFTVEFVLSAQPPSFKQAKLCYFIGEHKEIRSDEAIKYLPMPDKNSEGKYVFSLTEDTSDEIGGLDNALCFIRLITEGNSGDSKIIFRSFEFERKLNFEPVRQRQIQVAQAVGKIHGVTPFVTFEVSDAGHHKNSYDTKVPVINYEELDFKVSQEYAISHIKKHGGIFSYNHPFTEWKNEDLSDSEKEAVVDNLIETFSKNRVYGAALMEVGFPYEKESFYDRHYLRLWDGLSLRGVFITGDGDSDNHYATEDGWTRLNNFATFAGIYDNEAPTEDSFRSAFLRGSVWFGNPVYIKELSYLAEGEPMGSIFVNKPVEIHFDVHKINCEGYALRIVNGKTDKKIPIKNGMISDTFTLECNNRFNFARMEIRGTDDVLIASTNPIYIVKDEKDIYSEAMVRRVKE